MEGIAFVQRAATIGLRVSDDHAERERIDRPILLHADQAGARVARAERARSLLCLELSSLATQRIVEALEAQPIALRCPLASEGRAPPAHRPARLRPGRGIVELQQAGGVQPV